MRKRHAGRMGLVAVAFAAAIGGTATVAAQESTPVPSQLTPVAELCGMAGMSMESTPMAAGDGTAVEASFDLAFIDLMIVHHKGAIDMAVVALERGEHEEIRALAQAIIDTQQAEIVQLTAWRDAWFPGAATLSEEQAMTVFDRVASESPGMSGVAGASEMMGPHDGLMVLCGANPGQFDFEFINGMIPHHEGAVLMAQSALNYAERPELKEFAEAVIAAQQPEIDQMTAWLALWYPEATPGHSH